MRVAALVHFAPPWRNAGSETVLRAMLNALAGAGHEVRCYVTDIRRMPEVSAIDDVSYHRVPNAPIGIREILRFGAQATLTHHQNSVIALRYLQGRRTGRVPVVYLTHNHMDYPNARPLQLRPDLVVHNSQWVADALDTKYGAPTASLIVRPPLDYERHRVEATGDAVTLVNTNTDKGSAIFYRLAERNPAIPFLAVEGGHGPQHRPPRTLGNVTWVPATADMKPVWSGTRVLAMPSIYESYGLVGVEAGCSGIPTICSDTPGLRESQGSAGVFVADRDDVDQWHVALNALLSDDAYYADRSQAAAKNSMDLADATARDLARFVAAVEDLA